MEPTVPGMAEAIAQRSEQRGLTPSSFAELAGLTQPGLAPVRKGARKAYSRKTVRGVAVALAWPIDWYVRLVAGEDWRTFPDTPHNDAPWTTEERLSSLESRLDRIEALLETRLAPS